MCNFCVQHGEGKRWYLNAKNYAMDLASDLERRNYMVEFVQKFERNRMTTNAGLTALKYAPLPRVLKNMISSRISEDLQRYHFGQAVPLELCEQIFEIATNITRLPCVCRGAMKRGSNAESCCIVMTVKPQDAVIAEAFSSYTAGPDAEGFERLTKEKAVAYLRRAEERGLCHTVWTFHTPFIAAICNCDLPSGCMAMKIQLKDKVRIMWRGEDVMHLDSERCSGCQNCVKRCPFGALHGVPRRRKVTLDRAACWGCGTCRASCHRGALKLEPRHDAPDVAHLW